MNDQQPQGFSQAEILQFEKWLEQVNCSFKLSVAAKEQVLAAGRQAQHKAVRRRFFQRILVTAASVVCVWSCLGYSLWRAYNHANGWAVETAFFGNSSFFVAGVHQLDKQPPCTVSHSAFFSQPSKTPEASPSDGHSLPSPFQQTALKIQLKLFGRSLASQTAFTPLPPTAADTFLPPPSYIGSWDLVNTYTNLRQRRLQRLFGPTNH